MRHIVFFQMAFRKFCSFVKQWIFSFTVLCGLIWCYSYYRNQGPITSATFGADFLAEYGSMIRRNPSDEGACKVPLLIQYGIPWPKCQKQIFNSSSGLGIKHPCLEEYFNASDLCSKLRYLSEVTRDCPPVQTSGTWTHPFYENERANARKRFDDLYEKMREHQDYLWMLNRIKRMEALWIHSAGIQFTPDSPRRAKKRIHVHMGLLEWGLAKNAGKGAPVGELVQWSDLLASLHAMGHDMILTRNSSQVRALYDDFLKSSNKTCYKQGLKIPFDLVYTDIIGYKEVIGGLFEKTEASEDLKCRIRVVDTWGTEADFNDPEYASKRRRKLNFYGGLGIDLRQFNTLYPHTPDNTFLGFVIEKIQKEYPLQKRDIAMLYAKTKDLLDKKYRYIDIIAEYFPQVHATIANWANHPAYVTNHGVLSQEKFAELLTRTKVFVGFGSPFEGPGALEAIQLGAVFLNRKIMMPLGEHPTSRVLTSQNTYAETIGKPYVYTLDVDNETEVRKVLKEVVDAPEVGSFLPFEFSTEGMLQRVSVLVEKQNFCAHLPYIEKAAEDNGHLWPPRSALKETLLTETGENCKDACRERGLICEATFFPILNRKAAFLIEDENLCDAFESEGELEYPAYDPVTKICYLQTNQRLFSCAGNYLGLRRLCPCRDFRQEQIALCKDCLLP